VKRLPDHASLDHLKKQAKDLIRLYRSRDPGVLARFRDALPAAAGQSDGDIAARDFRLHDAQSCIAREYGFASWSDLRSYVAAQPAAASDRAARVLQWLKLAYAGDVTGTLDRAAPRVAIRVLADNPDLTDAPSVACAAGNEEVLRRAVRADPGFVNRPGGPLRLPPLLAVAHSALWQAPAFADRLFASARFLLVAGADPNQRIGQRFPPRSIDQPDDTYFLSALYGAAGLNRHPELTKLLLDAGADPNDGESLYHSLENLACTRLLLTHGARVAGSNAVYRSLDLADAAPLELLLQHGGDPNEPANYPPLNELGSPLLRAIRRLRSRRHIEALLAAGADISATTPHGVSAYRLALQLGLEEIVALLAERGAAESVPETEQFVAACARGDAAEARRIAVRRPDLPGALSPVQLRALPELVEEGRDEGPRLMVALGWPIAVRGGDLDGSALNQAVFRGNAELTRFLLEHGASWTEEHRFGDNVCGTLSWASRNEPVAGGDWAGCARALLDHGLSHATPDPEDPECVLIGGRKKRFSDEVTEVLLNGAGADVT
jgi:ankyrin repeat protein